MVGEGRAPETLWPAQKNVTLITQAYDSPQKHPIREGLNKNTNSQK